MQGITQFDQTKFWTSYKSTFGFAPQSQIEVDETNGLLALIAADTLLERVEWGAFLLGTIRNECGAHMQPIKEKEARHDSRVWLEYQQHYWNTGYYGRGFSQLTLLGNYRQFSQLLYNDDRLVKNPDLVLQPEVGYQILSIGSVRGLFRHGYKLADFLNDAKTDFLDARQIVNGINSPLAFQAAQRYAGYAEKYNTCLKNAAVV